MKVLIVPIALVAITFAQIPLPSNPDWRSSDNDYSTGGSFADVNGDGYIDFLISNGNDMANNSNSVYLNESGTLENTASWRSADQGNFGHSYTGDVNNDGLLDLAVAYLGPDTSTTKMVTRIYLNNGAGLDSQPYWRAADRVSSFDCCLGDYDLDGDLDLAISAGDAYQEEMDRVRIYKNNAGVFETMPSWYSKLDTASDAIRFADIDNDGDLDLFVGHRRKIVMYRNENGSLDTIPSWVARKNVGWVLRLAFGDYDGDGYLDLAAAANDQLGDPNGIMVFHNNNGSLDTVATFHMQRQGRNNYSSCVAWGDVNGDGYPELAAGGWWKPVVVYQNHNGMLDTLPAWSWYPSYPEKLVGEALVWGDIRNCHLEASTDTFTGNGIQKLFHLSHRPVQFLDSVLVNGVLCSNTQYCYDPLLGWISFATPPTAGSDGVQVYYRYSTYPDLAVTNWEPNEGNYLFLNTTPTSIAEAQPLRMVSQLKVVNSLGWGMVSIQSINDNPLPPTIAIYSQEGRLVNEFKRQTEFKAVWDGRGKNGEQIPAGIYFLTISGYEPVKLIRLRQE